MIICSVSLYFSKKNCIISRNSILEFAKYQLSDYYSQIETKYFNNKGEKSMQRNYSILTIIFLFLLTGAMFAQPTITQQPTNKTVWEGDKVTFTVKAEGDEPLMYQWRKNGADITGGDVLGTERVLNGNFTNWDAGSPSNWIVTGQTDTNAFVEEAAGAARIYSDGPELTLAQARLQDGLTYVYQFEVTSFDSGVVYFQNSTDAYTIDSITASGTYQGYFKASAGTGITFKTKPGIGSDVTIDNVMVKEVISSPHFSTYQTPALSRDDNGAKYSVVVTNPGGNSTSNDATLIVQYFDGRVTDDLEVLYDFQTGSGTRVLDVSGNGTAADLSIETPELAVWTDNGLFANDGTIIRSDTTNSGLLPIFETSDEITIETWIRPSIENTPKLAKIFTFSNSSTYRNFVLQQNGDKYEVLLRRIGALEGEPAVVSPAGTVNKELTHVVYTRAADGTAKMYINGTEVASLTQPGEIDFSDAHRLALATEIWGEYHWKGAYYLVALYSRALTQNEVTNNFSEGVAVDEFPVITIQPADKSVLTGENVTFRFEAYSTLPISYQWKKNGSNIPGATGTSYTISNVSINDNNDVYSAVATNSAGEIVSRDATLSVTASGDRITAGLSALYTFEEGEGNAIDDRSGNGDPLNLTINTPGAVEWTDFGLRINSAPSIISTRAASKIVEDVSASNEITLEAWVKPENDVQFGPRRIVTMSNGNPRNFTLGQQAKSYEAWIKSTNSNEFGNSVSSTSILTPDLTHVVFTRSADKTAKFFINGVEVVSEEFKGDFTNWDNGYLLSVGNEIGMEDREFLGLLNLIAVYSRALSPAEVMQNYGVGASGDPEVIAPSNIVVTVNSQENIELMWRDNSVKEEGYIIERGQGSPVNYAVIDTINANDSVYVDLTANPNQLYSYRVKGYNYLKTSEYSPVGQNLLPPAGLTAKSVTLGEILLEWNNPNAEENGFVLERSVNNDTEFAVYDTLANVESYLDTNVVDASTYFYRLRAIKGSVRSGLSNVADSRALITPIVSPSKLSGEPADNPVIVNLTWEDNSDNEAGFVIERRQIQGDPDFIVIDTVNANVAEYTDTSVSNYASYVYKMYAYNADTTSEYSDVAIVDIQFTGVEDEELLPTEYSVSQNFPNPFNPSTSIKFALPEASKVTLKIFNLLGQEVSTLVNQNYDAGRYEVQFNAQSIASGIYIYSISAEGINGNRFIESKKMTLLK